MAPHALRFCYHCGDVLVPERDRCERCPAECDGDCKEADCAARIEVAAIPDPITKAESETLK